MLPPVSRPDQHNFSLSSLLQWAALEQMEPVGWMRLDDEIVERMPPITDVSRFPRDMRCSSSDCSVRSTVAHWVCVHSELLHTIAVLSVLLAYLCWYRCCVVWLRWHYD